MRRQQRGTAELLSGGGGGEVVVKCSCCCCCRRCGCDCGCCRCCCCCRRCRGQTSTMRNHLSISGSRTCRVVFHETRAQSDRDRERERDEEARLGRGGVVVPPCRRKERKKVDEEEEGEEEEGRERVMGSPPELASTKASLGKTVIQRSERIDEVSCLFVGA